MVPDGSRHPVLPDAVVVLLRRLGLPVATIARYWAAEARSIQEGTMALALGLVATLIAGVVLIAGRGQLQAVPGLMVLIPAAIGLRGSVFGALGARLGTGILTGQLSFVLRRDSFLGRQIEAAVLLTISTTAEGGLLAWGIARLVGREPVPLLDLVSISVVGGTIASVVLLGVTVGMARTAHEQGWNMDDVSAPVITAAGDLVTLPALLLATLLLPLRPLVWVVGAGGLAAGLGAVVVGWRHEHPDVRRVMRESLVVLTGAVTLQLLGGVVLESREEALVQRVPALLGLVPPFMATCGSLGGMLASRLASKLHLGLLQPRALPGQLAHLDVSVTFLLGTAAFTGVGAVGWLGALLVGVTPPALPVLVGVALLGGLLATTALSLVAYGVAAASFRFGFDPDNHGIPAVTATMDLLGILCLVSAIALLRVG